MGCIVPDPSTESEAAHSDHRAGSRSSPVSSAPAQSGFTRVDLLVVIATLLLLALVVMPSWARSREGGHEAVCLNHLRQLGVALMMYSDENHDIVPNEGNTVTPINNLVNADAWYNLAVRPNHPKLVDLYTSGNIPLPQSDSVFSCPGAAQPTFIPTTSKAYFMYGINGRLVVNSTPTTRLSSVPLPRDTILMAEVDGNNPTAGAAQSSVTGQYAIGRHQGFGFFTMVDGHVRSARTNEFLRTSTESNSASSEWAIPRTMYWFPTSTTPN